MLSEKSKISENGRILVPASFRKAMGLKGGESVTLTLDEDGLHSQSKQQIIARAQAAVREIFGADPPAGHLLSEELIAERRSEARREEEDD